MKLTLQLALTPGFAKAAPTTLLPTDAPLTEREQLKAQLGAEHSAIAHPKVQLDAQHSALLVVLKAQLNFDPPANKMQLVQAQNPAETCYEKRGMVINQGNHVFGKGYRPTTGTPSEAALTDCKGVCAETSGCESFTWCEESAPYPYGWAGCYGKDRRPTMTEPSLSNPFYTVFLACKTYIKTACPSIISPPPPPPPPSPPPPSAPPPSPPPVAPVNTYTKFYGMYVDTAGQQQLTTDDRSINGGVFLTDPMCPVRRGRHTCSWETLEPALAFCDAHPLCTSVQQRGPWPKGEECPKVESGATSVGDFGCLYLATVREQPIECRGHALFAQGSIFIKEWTTVDDTTCKPSDIQGTVTRNDLAGAYP